MLSTKLTKNFDSKNASIFIGLDVHLHKWSATVLSEYSFIKTFSLDADHNGLINYIKNNHSGTEVTVAYEAGFSGFWLQRFLTDNEVGCIVVNPADIPSTNKDQLSKTDRHDSKRIALALRSGFLREIYVPTVKQQDLRSLNRERQRLSKEIGKIKCSIKSLLFYIGVPIPPEMKDSRTKRYLNWLKTLELSSYTRISMDSKIAQYEVLRGSQLKIIKQIRIILNDYFAKEMEILRSVPGIGHTICYALISEIGDIRRFKTCQSFISYIGLCPTEHSSGEKIKKGSITPRHNKNLRKLLVESSWIAIRRDTGLLNSYTGYCRRMENNKALVRIARKIAIKIYYIWIKNKKYEVIK